MVATPHDGQGTTVTFGGSTYTVTDITVNFTDAGGDDSLDVSHLGLVDGSAVATQARPLVGGTTDTGTECQIELLGGGAPSAGTEAQLVISGAVVVNACSRCTASSIRATVNDVVRSSATFRVGTSGCSSS